MEHRPSEAEILTRRDIRARLEKFREMDRELTTRLAAMYGKPILSPPVSDPEKTALARAKELLNGSAARLMPARARAIGTSEGELFIERDAVRLCVAALSSEDTALAAIETGERVLALTPEWRTLCRKWLLAAAVFNRLEARANAFLEGAGEAAAFLPMTRYIGIGASIDANGDPFRVMAAAAIGEGIATADELERK